MRHLVLVFIGLLLFACSDKTEEIVIEDKPSTTVKNEVDKLDKKDLVEIKNSMYVEYYPGKKKVKFKGPQDENSKRNGKWTYYSETGVELSMTIYSHGIPHGHTMVKYPNGNIHYVGEYENGLKIGVWTTYTPEGIATKTDYSK